LKPIPEAKTHVSVPVTRKSKNIMRPRTSQPASRKLFARLKENSGWKPATCGCPRYRL